MCKLKNLQLANTVYKDIIFKFQSLVVIIVSNNKRRIILIDVVFIATYCIQIQFFLNPSSSILNKQDPQNKFILPTKKKLFRPLATIFKLKNPKNKLFIWCGLNISSLKNKDPPKYNWPC